MFLAIGILDDPAATWSIATKSMDADTVARELAREQNDFWPEEILLIDNDEDCPIIIGHFFHGKHYSKS